MGGKNKLNIKETFID